MFSDNALRIIQVARGACEGYLERIVNALRFNLVSKRKSYVSYELWERVGSRVSMFLYNLADSKINIDVLSKGITPNDFKFRKCIRESHESN